MMLWMGPNAQVELSERVSQRRTDTVKPKYVGNGVNEGGKGR